MRRRTTFSLVALVAALLGRAAHAQERSSDVGGQPARRKLTKMPRLVTFVQADYPAEKRAAGISAAVILTLEISPTGNVTKVQIAESAGPDFDAAAIAAAERFVFEPAEVDDKPAPSKITYRYAFVIEPERADGRSKQDVEVRATGEPTTPAPSEPPTAAREPPRPQDIEVRGQPRTRREVIDYRVRAEQAKRVAGTQGDVLKVVQNLPGVSRPPMASGQLVVWGSAPRETRVYVDGVDLPALYHGSGLRGTINSDLVASIDLVPGGFGAEYGRGLGGLVRVETRALPKGTHGYVGVDSLDGSALVSTAITPRARVAAAVRYGWLDRALALVSAPDVGDFFPIPRYRDAQIKATIDLRDHESVDAVVLVSADALDRTVPSPDPGKRRSEATQSGFLRAYARYTSVGPAGTATVTPFFGQDSSALDQRFGGAPARLSASADRYGVRGSLSRRLGRDVSLASGLDALGTFSTVTREGSLSLPPREGDLVVFGQPPGDEYAFDRWKTHIVNVAPYVYADVRIGSLTVTPQLRFDAYMLEGNKRLPPSGSVPPVGIARFETAFAPRASARWDVTSRYAVTAAYGQYHQAPEPEDFSPTFGTPELGLSRATHLVAGQSLRITETTSLDVAAFDKTLKDIVVRSRLANPLRARSLTQNGQGHVYGIQVLLRRELWRGFFGWASYALTRSERRYDGDEHWRLFDFDQPHVLSVVASQELGRWTFGARFRVASGNPRTPVVGNVYDARSDRFDPVFGPQNTTRIPTFWQLDVRVDHETPLGGGARLLVFADLQNVTNHQNAEEIVYTADYRERGAITGLPFLAVVGARLAF